MDLHRVCRRVAQVADGGRDPGRVVVHVAVVRLQFAHDESGMHPDQVLREILIGSAASRSRVNSRFGA